MAGLDVGQGLWNYVVANGDQPIEDFTSKTNKNGTRTETVHGKLGRYYATNATGQDGNPSNWEYYGPFAD